MPGSEITFCCQKIFWHQNQFWGVKILWRRERHYVTIPVMAVWEHLACLAPDIPERWTFADVRALEVHIQY